MTTPQPEDSFQTYLAALLALYISAEDYLLGGIAGILRITRPTILSQILALSRMRRLTQQANAGLAAGDRWVQPMLQRAIEAGAKTAGTEIVRTGIPPKPPKTPGTDLARNFDFSIPHGERSVQAIRDDLVSSLTDVRRRITRLPDDIYKVISPATAAGQALGHGYTPAQAQAYAWREYVRQGITGFTDRSGRNWSLSAYVEMSVRTATMRAYNDSHLQVMQAAHVDLFTVPDDGHPCPLCFPWQNRILSIEPDERAAATIAEATAAGLFHPNCKHILAPVIPDVTVLPRPREWTEQDALDYKNTQHQRRLELEIRKAKRQLEYAVDPSTQAAARADVRDAQARMRQFINETGFLRQSRREQLDLANDHLKLPALR